MLRFLHNRSTSIKQYLMSNKTSKTQFTGLNRSGDVLLKSFKGGSPQKKKKNTYTCNQPPNLHHPFSLSLFQLLLFFPSILLCFLALILTVQIFFTPSLFYIILFLLIIGQFVSFSFGLFFLPFFMVYFLCCFYIRPFLVFSVI